MKKGLSIFLFSFLMFSVNAQIYKLEQLTSKENIEKLKKDGMIHYIHPEESRSLIYAPDTEFNLMLSETMVEKNAIPYITEYIYFIPKSKLLKDSSKTELTIKDIETVVRSVSKMQGMRYHFSEKYPDGKDVLYKKCYNIANPASDVPIPDILEGETDGLESYCLQYDNTYGDTRYKLNYYKRNGILDCTFLNQKSMGLLGIDAVKPESMRINIISADCGEYIFLYMSCDVNSQKIPLFNVRKKIAESMQDRMDAIYRWFLLQFK